MAEPKDSQQMLREIEERHRLLLEEVSDGLWEWDVRTGDLYWNDRLFEILGLSRSEFTPTFEGFMELVYPEDRQQIIDINLGALELANPEQHQASYTKEMRIRHRAGDYRYYIACARAHRDQDGVLLSTAGILIDITERKQAENALKQSEERFRAQYKGIPIPTISFQRTDDGDFVLVDYNDAANELHRDRIFNLLGRTASELYSDKPEVLEWFSRCFEEQTSFKNEMWWEIFTTGETRRFVITFGFVPPDLVVLHLEDISARKKAEEALRESHSEITNILESITDAFYTLDRQWRFTYLNQEAERILQRSKEELLGKNVWEEFPEAVGSIVYREYHKAETEGTSVHFEMFYQPLGRWLEVHGYPSPEGLSVYFRDITERKRLEEALRESEERFRRSFRDASIGMGLTSLDGRWLQVNRSLCDIVGYSEKELLNTTFQEITHPEDLDVDLGQMRRVVAGEIRTFQMEKRYFHKKGHVVWILLNISLVRDEGGEPLYCIAQIQDITQRKRAEEQLRHQALHDSLTGLPNRYLFLDRLEHALARANRYRSRAAVLFMDLDNFKVVNDSLGHDAGDRLLTAVAERLESCLRHEDTAARLGGDEFAVLLEDVADAIDAVEVARRIAERLRTPIVLEEHELCAEVSVGITLGGAKGDRPEDLLRRADVALYEAKRKGKANYEVFAPHMDARALGRLRLQTDLRQAIESEEFRVHYQPKVLLGTDLQQHPEFSRNPAIGVSSYTSTARIVGMEALIRWEHPEQGLISPTKFIPLAEETGLIIPIGRWVLEEACHQAREWQDRYPSDPSLMVSVNLSARQFEDPRLAQDVALILEETGLDPRGLVLEITESVAMKDAYSSIGTFTELKALGIKLAIDDFGTGYSSLSYLKRFPADYLKIDRSFVSGLGEDSDDQVIVSGMTGLAHTLGMKVIAEGVETAEQLAQLQETGCDLVQGYYFSKPLPVQGASELLSTNDFLREEARRYGEVESQQPISSGWIFWARAWPTALRPSCWEGGWALCAALPAALR